MVNNLDEEWFGRKNVFNTEQEDHSWIPTEGKIAFPSTKKHNWHDYVDSRRLENHLRHSPIPCIAPMTPPQEQYCPSANALAYSIANYAS